MPALQFLKSPVDPVKSTIKIHWALIFILFLLVSRSIILQFVMHKMKHHEYYATAGGGYTPGTLISCEEDVGTPNAGKVYQINKGRRFWIENPTIAQSCNGPNWGSQVKQSVSNCSSIPEGPSQSVNCSPVAPPGGFTLVNPRTG